MSATVFGDVKENDPRPFLKVDLAGEVIEGLLDSGASVTCLGQGALDWLDRLGIHWTRLKSSVRTADGNPQIVLGFFDTSIKYGEIFKMIRVYVVPSLSQSLYLGIDFWRAFGILPMSIDSITGDIEEPKVDSKMHKLSSDQRFQLDLVTKKFPSFAVEGLGTTSLHTHRIDTGDAQPVKQRHYPISPAMQKLVDEEVNRMLKLGVIEESESSWSSPIVIVKKANGKSRLCLDSRKLNEVTKKDAYPLPKIDGHLGRLANTKYISSIDLKDAFWQIQLDPLSREKTAFSIPGRPLYHFRSMPFGLCNAAQSMCRLMDKVIPHEYHDRVFVYIDDLLVVSPDFESHLKLLSLVAERLRHANLTINVEKSKFCLREIKYLGFIIGDGCIKTDPEKISAIIDFPVPKSVRQIRRFVGMSGWYRRFIRNYATIAAPMTDLMSTANVKFEWNDKAQTSFEKLKDALASAPLLTHPDFSKRFFIQCDASMSGVGSVLFQISDDGKENPIAYLSQKLTKAQRNYSVTELECLAAVLSVKKFRAYIEGMPFSIITDHASLKWLMEQRDLCGRLARWSLKLQGFDFTIEHRQGKMMVVPDALSRAYADEIVAAQPEQYALDLESEHFQSPEYMAIRQTVIDNPNRMPDLKVDGNLVFRRTKFRAQVDSLIDESGHWRLWVPRGVVQDLVSQAHDHPLSAHGGIAKTLERLRGFYYWPRMVIDVKTYVGKCEICKETKAPNYTLRPPMGGQFRTERPFQQLYVDLLGPYPRSKSGNTFIFIVLDHFSKFVLLKPIRAATSINLTRYLEKDVFHLFGTPQTILSDNGKQFVSKLIENLCKTYGVGQLFTALYSPQANASERVNRSIIAAIAAYIESDHSKWDDNLTAIASALRSSIHVATGHTAYYLVFGRSMITHASQYGLLKKFDALNADIDIVEPNDIMQLISESVQKNLEKAYEKGVKIYNTRLGDVEFVPGQEVYRRNFVQSNFANAFNAKFARKFLKCRVRSKVGHARYELEDLSGKLIGIFHAKDIKQ